MQAMGKQRLFWRVSHAVADPKLRSFFETWWNNRVAGAPGRCCYAEFLTTNQLAALRVLIEAAGTMFSSITFKIIASNMMARKTGHWNDKPDPLSVGQWAHTELARLVALARRAQLPPYTVEMPNCTLQKVSDIRSMLRNGDIAPPFLADAESAGVEYALVSFDATLACAASRDELKRCVYKMCHVPFHEPLGGERPPPYSMGAAVSVPLLEGGGRRRPAQVVGVVEGSDGQWYFNIAFPKLHMEGQWGFEDNLTESQLRPLYSC